MLRNWSIWGMNVSRPGNWWKVNIDWQIHRSSLRTKQIFLPTSSCQVRLVDFWSFVTSCPLSHWTLFVIIYCLPKVCDVIEYLSRLSIVFASTFCSSQVHTFLWYISCLSSDKKLLVIISSWPKGCYIIEVSWEWMYQDWTTAKSWITSTNPPLLTRPNLSCCNGHLSK